jgi:flagellar biosynthesis/type III secretory pathway M-ring protein FliF/YscJ
VAVGKTIDCPRCKLPQKDIDECEYCGLVFNEKSKARKIPPAENFKNDNLANCQFCKAEIPRNAESCPHCGKLQIIKTKKIVWIGIAAFILLFSLVIPYFLEQSKDRLQNFTEQDKEKRIQQKPKNQIKYAAIPSFKVIKNEDVNNLPVNIKRIRTLLVEKKLTKAHKNP